MKKITFTFIMLISITAFAQNSTELLNNYMNIKNALVKSDSELTSQAVVEFYSIIKTEPNFKQKKNILKITEKLNESKDIEKQRILFSDLSTIIWDIIKESKKGNVNIYYQYCPMKKAYWLSKDKDIKNPYYGSSMLTCGNVVDSK